jgi:HlyD family secretion protein
VQTLSVREGDTVKIGDPLFTVDNDLQLADLAQVKASVRNAQQTFDRAFMLERIQCGRRHRSADLLPAWQMVPAGRLVLSLLPPGNIKVRFYVPDTVLPSMRMATKSKSAAMVAQAGSRRG